MQMFWFYGTFPELPFFRRYKLWMFWSLVFTVFVLLKNICCLACVLIKNLWQKRITVKTNYHKDILHSQELTQKCKKRKKSLENCNLFWNMIFNSKTQKLYFYVPVPQGTEQMTDWKRAVTYASIWKCSIFVQVLEGKSDVSFLSIAVKMI